MGSNSKAAGGADCTNEDLEQIVTDVLVDDKMLIEKLQRLDEVLREKDQNEECRLLSLRVTRHLLNVHKKHAGDKAHKLSQEARKRFASTLVHTLWQEAPVTGQPQSELKEFLSFDDLEVIYQHLVKMFPLLSDSILSTIAKILDLPKAENLQKALFKAVFRACTEAPIPSATYDDCLSLCAGFLEEGDDSILPSLEMVLDHLSSFKMVDRECTIVRFLYDLLQQTEGSISACLRNSIRTRLAAQASIDTKQKPAVLNSSHLLSNLVHHMAAALPTLMGSLVPPAATDMANASEKDALDALELLQLLIAAPSSSMKHHNRLLQQFLATADNASQRVRLKFVNSLSTCLPPKQQLHSTLRLVEQTLMSRFWDPVPAVRAAAIRNVVVYTASWAEEERDTHGDDPPAALDDHMDLLDKIVLRLMDSVPDVREEALKASFTALSACLHAAASSRESSDFGPLSGPSDLVKRFGASICKLLHSVSHGANRRLLAQLGEAPGMALIPATGNTNFDAWLLTHLLSNAECTSLLKSLLEWQNGLRVQLSAVLTARKMAARADQGERTDAQKKVEAAVATLVKHWSAVMPKGNLTAGALKHLLEHRDNKLFDGIMELCVSPHVAPAFPPVFNQKKRGGGHRGPQKHVRTSQEDSMDGEMPDEEPVATDAMISAAGRTASSVLQDLRQRLRARSKEVLVLVRTAALNILSPAHIQALLEMVGDVAEEALTRSKLPDEVQLMQTAVSAIRKAIPMMLKGLGNDLLYCASHDGGLRRSFALILASSGGRIINPVPMMPANQSMVLTMMQGVVEDGPVRCAKALPRAALALLPQAMAASVIQQLVTHCMGIMHEGRTDAAGANAVHVLCEVARDHPAQVAGDLNAIVAWVFDTLLPSDAPEAAAGRPGAALTIPPQAAHSSLNDLPLPLHHRTALLAALAKSIAEGGSTSSSSVDRAAAATALATFVPRTLEIMNPDAELTGYHADSPLERGALRLAAADALLKVGSRLDKELPGQAFVEMGLVMQDEIGEVRSAFAGIIHGVISNHYKHLVACTTSQRISSPDAVAMGKYVSMLALAVEWAADSDLSEPLSKLVLWLHTWNKHTVDISSAAGAAEDTGEISGKAKKGSERPDGDSDQQRKKKGKTAGSVLPSLPEYSIFFLIYILSHHDDFPSPEMLAEYSESITAGDGAAGPDPMVPELLSSFERMLSFHIHALLATSQNQPRTLALIKFFTRIILQCTEDAEGDTYATQAQQLLADMALKIAVAAVDADTATAASEMLNPGNCHIPSRLFKRRDAAGTAADLVRTPSWHKLQGLPKHLTQIISKAMGAFSSSTAAGKGRGAGAATGGWQGAKAQAGSSKRAGKQTNTRGGKSDRSRSRGRTAAVAKALEDDDDVSNSGDDHMAADSGDGDEHQGGNTITGEHDAISSEQGAGAAGRKPRQKARGAGETGGVRSKGRASKIMAAGGKEPKVAGGSGTRKSIKKRGKSLGGPSTPRSGGQQTLLAPFGAQKVPDVSSPAGSGSKPRRASERTDRSHGNHGSDDSHSPDAPFSADDIAHSDHSAGNSAQLHDIQADRNPQKRHPAAPAPHTSPVSADAVSDSEMALPVKHRTKAAASNQAAQQSKQQPVPPSSTQAAPIAAEDEDGSDVESPPLPSGGPSSACAPHQGRSKKRSKVQLESIDPPSAGQDTCDEEGKRKRSKGETAPGTKKRPGAAAGNLMDDGEQGGGLTQPAGKAPTRTVKKKLFQETSSSAQGKSTDSAMLGRVDGSDGIFGFAESSIDEAADLEKHKHTTADDREQQVSEHVSPSGQISKSDRASEHAEADGSADSDASPGQVDSQCEKENQSKAPRGKLVSQQGKGKGRQTQDTEASPLAACI